MTKSPSYADLISQAVSQYRAGVPANGLAPLALAAELYPENLGTILRWQLHFTANMGETAETLHILSQSLDDGYWFTEGTLRSADFDALQGNPAFEKLVARCEEMRAAAQAKAKPDRIVLRPENGSAPYPLLLALHGNNDNAQITSGYWRPAQSLGWLVGVLQSSQVTGFSADTFVWTDIPWAKREVKAHISELKDSYDIDSSRVVIGGFSMGGRVTLDIAFKGDIDMCGFIAVGTSLPEDVIEDEALWEAARARNLRGYVIVGENDAIAIEGSRRMIELFRERGIACEAEFHPDMAHDYPDDFGDGIRRALTFITGG
jgi:pimeloyl-ACP methyl ester carboxylesterase